MEQTLLLMEGADIGCPISEGKYPSKYGIKIFDHRKSLFDKAYSELVSVFPVRHRESGALIVGWLHV